MHAIKHALLQSCKVYYAYLEEHNLGCEELQVAQVAFDNPYIQLRIKAKVLNTDSLMIQISSRTPMPLSEERGFCVRFYDEKSQILSIECLDPSLFNEVQKHKNHLKIFSDLKFLIQNLATFFEQKNSFAIPAKTPMFARLKPESTNAYRTITTPSYLTDEQANALRDILSKPFSYVWGAPGSGKTQVVLFEALLHYVYNNTRVCVLAPTNSALEQVLKALIKKFDSLNINRAMILRLGTPSNAFMEQYTEVCDPQILQKKQPQSLFGSVGIKSRLKESLVIGMTMDAFIKRYPSLDVEFAHFFLDECAFTPLIKALPLCTQDTPITLLGDHKQLMPICEMPTSRMHGDKAWANLFNLSALFIEDFFTQEHFSSNASIFSKSQTSPLQFTRTSLNILRKTHRYGDNLAKILDHHIYRNNLSGKPSPTELYFIDCKAQTPISPSQDKSSHAEAQVIAQIFPTLLQQSSSTAIITPFVNQRKLLSQYQIPYKHTWTIHGSQGQEFESVIFSPVMLHHHLTDSRNLNAAYALNVAISRIKQRLILVCDYAYWARHNEQFLTAILRNAKPFPMPNKPPTPSQTNAARVIDIITI